MYSEKKHVIIDLFIIYILKNILLCNYFTMIFGKSNVTHFFLYDWEKWKKLLEYLLNNNFRQIQQKRIIVDTKNLSSNICISIF